MHYEERGLSFIDKRQKANSGKGKGGKKRIRLAIVLLFLLFALRMDAVPANVAFNAQVKALVDGERFDFVAWEARAIADKLSWSLSGTRQHPSDAEEALVVEYFSRARRIRELENEIERAYTTAEEEALNEAMLSLATELDELKRRQVEDQGLVETILERQITEILNAQGFGAWGWAWPPVEFRFTPLPLYLVISPRQEIVLRKGGCLQGDLSLDQREAIEAEIDEALDMSSLIVGLGGLAAYPTMVLETASLDFVVKTAAHEWVHNYLFFKPLGQCYWEMPELRTVNEMVASIVGDEIGEMVIERYYPRYALSERQTKVEGQAEGFDFNREMRRIRRRVDRLLAEGNVERAEEYMEERRRFLASHGYYIRKLNQAYFALYGSYATHPTSIDPVVEEVRELRRGSASLKEFVDKAAGITSYQDLQQAVGDNTGHVGLRDAKPSVLSVFSPLREMGVGDTPFCPNIGNFTGSC